MHDLWVDVNRAALRSNFDEVQRFVGPMVKVCAVVKGNAYGHGTVEAARTFADAGAEMVAVTRIGEAEAIREAGISTPILVLAPILPDDASRAVALGLECAVDSFDLAAILNQAGPCRIHLKIDTGMGRLGVSATEAKALVERISTLPNVEITGVFSHLARGNEPDSALTVAQISTFQRVAGGMPGLRHLLNSAGTLRNPDAHFDMVRVGTLLYGQYPSQSVPKKLSLCPTWSLKARVISVRHLPGGHPIGYGAEYITKRASVVAVLPVGFADGFGLVPEGPIYRQSPLTFLLKRAKCQPTVEIRGQKAPVLGRVSMQLISVDVTDIPGVEVGDVATIPALRLATSPTIPRVWG